MEKKTFTLEHALYALGILLALAMRFSRLGILPLTDYEADAAMQVLGIVGGSRPELGSNPAYLHLTAILFAVLKASEFWARFWPALAGTALVAAPWFIRERIGRVPALVLVFGLAIDPGLNAISRLAGGPMLAITAVVLCLLMWLSGRKALAGVFGGMALLAGPAVWFGLLSLVLAWGGSRLIPATFWKARGVETVASPEADLRKGWKTALMWGAGTWLVLGSLFFFSPQGLAASFKSLLVFFSGWWTISDIPIGRVLITLPAYELLPLVFGLVCLGRGLIRRDREVTHQGIWSLVVLLMVVLHVGRQVNLLGWMLLPLWVLAAQEIGRHFNVRQANRWVAGGLMTFVFILLTLLWMNLSNLTLLDPLSSQARLQYGFMGGILLVVTIATILVGSGWSAREARLGVVWGGLVPLVIFTFAGATGTMGVRDPRTFEIWDPEMRLARADLVVKVADDISFLNTGFEHALPVRIIGFESSALEWMFRDWEVESSEFLAPGETPEVVITPAGTDLALTAEYRGEPLVWREVGDWYNATFQDGLKWFVFRQYPLLREDLILWVRADLLLDGQEPATP